MLTLSLISEENLEEFHFLDSQSCLANAFHDSENRQEHIVVGARLGQSPVGMALAIAKKQSLEVELLGLQVLDAHKKTELGTALLQYLEQELKARNFLKVKAKYYDELAEGAYLEKILLGHGWQVEKKYTSILYKGYPGCPFPIKLKPFSVERYSVSLFSEINEEEKQWFLNHPDIAPKGLYPYKPNEFPMEPLNSLVLRKDGIIKGWLITHRLDQKTICYSQWFVLEEARHPYAGPLLLLESLKRHFALRENISNGVFSTWKSREVKFFLEKHDFDPEQIKVRSHKNAYKDLA